MNFFTKYQINSSYYPAFEISGWYHWLILNGNLSSKLTDTLELRSRLSFAPKFSMISEWYQTLKLQLCCKITYDQVNQKRILANQKIKLWETNNEAWLSEFFLINVGERNLQSSGENWTEVLSRSIYALERNCTTWVKHFSSWFFELAFLYSYRFVIK